MSKDQNSAFIEELLDELDNEISDDDYGFILDSDGNLKSVFLPEDYDEIPDTVLEIFNLFGITDPEEINARIGRVVH